MAEPRAPTVGGRAVQGAESPGRLGVAIVVRGRCPLVRQGMRSAVGISGVTGMGVSAFRFARGTALLVSASLVATPALAAALPAPAAPVAAIPAASWTPASDVARDHGWGPPPRHHHHDDGIDGGDLIAGILLIGGIAAIASAASNAHKAKEADQDRYSAPPQPPEAESAPQYRAEPNAQKDWGEGGDLRQLDAAADVCVNAVSRRGEVDHVYSVDPSGDGYRVAGDFATGETFACAVSGGQATSVYYGNGGGASWDRDGAPYRATPAPTGSAAPATQTPPADDGRYDTSSAPDFDQSPSS